MAQQGKKRGAAQSERAASAGPVGTAAAERDLLDVYIAELSRSPVLSAPEQKALARRLRDTRLATPEREGAREALIRANLRFAFTIAKQYQHRGVDLADLVSEANAGLCRAADKYDPDVGVNFISYAVWWVRQALGAAVAKQGRAVRIPLSRTADLNRVTRAQAALREALDREPTDDEISRVTSLSTDVVRDLLAVVQPTRSLDEPTMGAKGEEGRALGERLHLVDDDADSVTRRADEASSRELLERALSTLPPRDRLVLVLYYGLERDEPMTLDQIAQQLGVTRERVRQLRDRALGALRSGEDVAALRDALREEWAA